VKKHGIRLVHATDRARDSLYALALSRTTEARSVVLVHVRWSTHYPRLTRPG
jgi:hypothetical protein